MLDAMLQEVVELQRSWASSNTPEMERRGRLIRREIPGFLDRSSSALRTAIPSISDLSIAGSDGAGRKNQIPWVRIHSSELSPNAQKGWYVVYLFDRDGNAVYLCLVHGSTINAGSARGIPEFRPLPVEEAAKLMAWAATHLDPRDLDRPGYTSAIELGGSSPLGRAYENTCVGALAYSRDGIPADETLISDVRFMLGLLDRLYRADAEDPAVPGKRPPEVQEAMDDIEINANPVANYSRQGFRLSATEKRVVELHAMKIAELELQKLGYEKIKDVSAKSSYDLRAYRDEQEYQFEVKGTTSAGEIILLTRNEVRLHLASFPHNGLIIVSHIELVSRGESPRAAGGKVELHIPWKIDLEYLEALGYEYRLPEGRASRMATPSP